MVSSTTTGAPSVADGSVDAAGSASASVINRSVSSEASTKKVVKKAKASSPSKAPATKKAAPRIELQRPVIREPNIFDTVWEYAAQFYEVSIKGSKATLKEVEKLGLKEKLAIAGRAAGKVNNILLRCYLNNVNLAHIHSSLPLLHRLR